MISVGTFHAGTVCNVIPDEAHFEATVRSFSADSHARVKDGAVRVCRDIAAAHGLTADVEFVEQYPVTVNHDAEAEFLADVVAEVHGEERFQWAP